MRKKIFCAVLSLLMLMGIPALTRSGAEPVPASEEKRSAAVLQTEPVFIGFKKAEKARDGKVDTFATGAAGASVRIAAQENISFLYLRFRHAPGEWMVSSAVVSASPAGTVCSSHGTDGFLHEYAEVARTHGETKEIELVFPGGVELVSVDAYGAGEIPADVQVWEPACDRADLLILSAHADDEQLYFSGMASYYAAVRDLKVQLVFFTEHFSEECRWHERLDALWVNGVRNYPVVSEFPDQYSASAEEAFRNFEKKGYSHTAIVDWMAAQLRRFRPYVAVTHSPDGEYGHGQHMAASVVLPEAAERAADAAFVTPGREAYDLPKLYLHNYGKNMTVLSCVDEPSDKLGGRTPFQLSQDGYLAHVSQLVWPDLTRRLYGNTDPLNHPEKNTIRSAAQMRKDNPMNWGLVRTAAEIPSDALRNDLFENIVIVTPVVPETTAPQTEPQTPETSSATEPAPIDTAAPTEPAGTSSAQTPDTPGTSVPGSESTSGIGQGEEQGAGGTFLWIVLGASLAALVVAIYLVLHQRSTDNRKKQ